MSDLIASQLAVSFAERELFSDVSLTVAAGDRIALVGPNGAGKTTLLRVLSGQLDPSAGSVSVPAHIRVALHDQRPERVSVPLREWAAPRRMVELETQLRELEAAMGDGDPKKLAEWEQVRHAYDHLGGESWAAEAERVMRGLGFREDQLDQPLDTLSGGELTRASLARTLASRPDVLLLDEPTNHLDIDTIDWLQEHLTTIRSGLVLVSHDRWFIEAVCSSVIEISMGRARRFNGSFVEYRAQQALEAATHGRQLERWKREVSRLQRFVDRFSAGTRARQAQSKAKVLDKLREDAPALVDVSKRASIGFALPKVSQPGRTVLEVKDLELAFVDEAGAFTRKLLEPSELVVERGEKIVLMGPNGAGKSTLMQALASFMVQFEEPPTAFRGGDARVGYDVRARLISQHDSELVDTQSLLGNMNIAAPNIARTDAQNLLGLFGFSGDDAHKLVGALSGGERRRLLLAMALTGSDNVLLVDEPTNHLDIESREALEAALAEWEGTLILISHDRALVEGVATRTIVLHDQRLTTVIGGYEQARAVLQGGEVVPTDPAERMRFEAAKQAERIAEATKKPSAKSSGGRNSKGSSAGDSSKRTVKRSGGKRGSKNRPKVRRPATIEAEIEALDAEIERVNKLMLDPDVYTDAAKSADALDQLAQFERKLNALWEELETSHEVHG